MPVYTTTLPNGQSIQVRGPTGATPEDIQQAALQIAAQRTPVLSPDSGKRDYSLGTAASKGFSRGTERIKSAFGDVIPAMAGKALGFDEYAERQMKEAQASQELVNRKYRAELQSYKDVQSIGDAIKFGIETVSEQIPNLATMVVPGAGLGVAARMGALGTKVTPGVAQGIGVYLGSYALNTPEVFQNIYEETGELATGTSLLFGAAAASLDSVLPSAILKNITPLQKLAISKAVIKKSGARPGLVESVFKGLAKGAATEGVTEGMQEAISISAENFVGDNPQIFDSEDWDRIMESSVRGSVAGGTFRGVSEPFGRAPAAPTPEPTPEPTITPTPEPTITPTKTEVAAATEATALAEATAATEAAAVAKTEADIKAMEAIEKTKVTQAAELGLDIEEDGQTATRSELVDPKNEDLGDQDVVYNWDSIKLTWEKQDELTPTDTSDRTQIAGRSDEVLVKSKDNQDAPPPTKPKRGKVGSDRTIVSPTGRREDVSDAALTDREKETNKKYPADLVLARDPYSLAGSLEKVPAESSEDYQKRLNNYLNNRIEGETEPEFNKRTGLKDIVSTSAKTGKPRKAQMLTDKLGDVQYAGEKRVRALSQIPPGTKIHWDGRDWIVDKHEITDQDRRTPGTIGIGLIQRGGARFSTGNKEGMVKIGDTEVMQVTSNLVDADTKGTNLYGLTNENTSSTIKDKPLDKTPATLGWQLTEKEANADKKLNKNKTAKQLEKEEARRSGEEIEETVAETWEEMSSSKVPFDKLSAENQLRLEEAREDLGITAELVDEIDQEVAPTQEQKVKQTLKKAATPLTIKEIAEQTDILEPNVRRITGQGAKAGKFERVDKGVYTLTTPDGKKIAHIEVGDAVNVLPKLVEQGEKFDMIFLDPAYFSSAVVGGTKGIKKYKFMYPPEFKKAMESVPDLIKNNDGHVYLMLSGARTAQKDMLPYLNAMNEVGLSVVGEGGYTKMNKNGTRAGFPTPAGYLPMAPERVFLFTKSGIARKGEKTLDNLDFRFVRPNVRTGARQSEKAPELLNALITNSTLEGESVLDPFAGSGVTGAEAVKAGRQATLVEKSEKAVEDYIIPKIEGAQDNIQESRTDTEGEFKAAQEAATRLLGLPPNNTALDRARAMGFDVDNILYHGTSVVNMDAFKLAAMRERDLAKLGKAYEGRYYSTNEGIYLTNNELVADYFASSKVMSAFDSGLTKDKIRKNVLPLFVKGKIFDFKNPEHLERLKQPYQYQVEFEKGLPGTARISEKDLDGIAKGLHSDIEANHTAISRLGFDGAKMFEPKEFLEGQELNTDAMTTVVYDPVNIRSVDAAFNPESATSPNLQFSREAPEGVVPTFEGKEIPQSLINSYIQSERAKSRAENADAPQSRSAATRLFYKLEEGMEDFLGLTFEQYQTEIEKPRDQNRVGKLMRTLDNILKGEPVGHDYTSRENAINTVNYKIDRSLIDKAKKEGYFTTLPRSEYLETKDIQESRTETEGTGQTAETVTTELVEEFGNNVNKTIEKGNLVIVDNVSQLPANIKMSSTANGAFDNNSGISYLVANRIQKGQARRILLHEIGEHYGLEKMVGKDYMSLLNRLKTLRKQNADVDAIFAQVQEQYPELKVNSKPFLQEVMAKVGESAPNNTLFRRMIGAVKNFLRRLGLYNVNKFSDTDIQDMILNSLRVSLAEATGTREQVSGIPALQMSKESEAIKTIQAITNLSESKIKEILREGLTKEQIKENTAEFKKVANEFKSIAGWSPTRLRQLTYDLGDQNNYITMMSPQDFLDLAASISTKELDESIDRRFGATRTYKGKKYGAREKDMTQLEEDIAKAEPKLSKNEVDKKASKIFFNGQLKEGILEWDTEKAIAESFMGLGGQPHLNIEGNEVVGHEGRHRARALQRLGITQFPVVINKRDKPYGETPPVGNEVFTQEDGTKKTYVKEAIYMARSPEAIQKITAMVSPSVNPDMSQDIMFSKGRYDDYPYLPSSDVDMIIDLGGVDRREAQGVFAKANNYIQNLPAAQSGIGREIVSRLSTIPDYLAGAYVSFLSIPNKIELFAKELPALNNLLTFIQNKADIIKQGREEVSIRLRNADRITNKYKETPRGKKILEEWNTVLLELSRENVNPETIINDPAARAELERGTLIKGSRIYREKAIELVERYERLPKDLKDLANQIVNELKGRYNTLLETMIEAFPSAETQLRDRFTALNYYLPMVRKGNYWFKYMTKDGEEGKASATTPFLREQMKKKLAAQGATQFENFSRTQLAQISGSAPAAFVENLKSAIEKNEVLDTKSQIAIVKTIEEQYLALFPEQSLRNQETHRKGVPGYINDVIFAYSDTAPKIIASTANAKYNTQIINASNTINQDATDSESAIIRAIGRDTIKSVPFYINPIANAFAAMPAYASYVWFLGGNISSAVVNITQLPLIVMPFLQGEYGFDTSQKALFKAMKLYTEGGFEENREFLPDRTAAPFKVDPKTGKKTYSGKNAELFKEGGKYYNLFKDAEQAAALRRGVGYEIIELRKNLGDEVTAGTKIKTKVEAGVGYIFQNSERLNREITLIAAFDLARSKGMLEKDAIQKAIELTSKVHSHALPEAGPRLFQDGLGKVTFVFKRFAQAQIYLVSKLFKDVFGAKPKNEAEQRAKDIARNQLLGVYGYSFLMAGVQGMPFYGGATILASLLFDDEDDPLDPHTAVNQAVGNFAYRGPLSNLVGIDISQRTGFRDLVFREDPARLEKIGAAAYMLEVLGGPGYSAVRRFTEGVGDVANGEIGRGAEKMLPTALGNTLKTVRYNTEGMTNRYGVPIIEGDPSVYESFMQLVGFTNIELSEAYTEANALRGPERKLQKRRSHLLLKYFLAKQTGDTSGMENIQEEIDAFNKKAPRGFTITPSVRNRSMRSREERLKNSVKGVYISKTRRPGLEERYSFDD